MKPRQAAPAPGGGIGQPFVPFRTAQTGQRVNGSGLLAVSGADRASQTITTSIGAGQTTQFPAAGQSFYLRASSAPLNIRPKGGPFDSYTTGTGYSADPENLFNLVEVQNPNNFPVAFSLFVGFGDFIDKRLILQTGVIYPTWYLTYSQPPTGGPIAIPDLSGSAFQDLNGTSWVALNRLALYVDNPTGSNILVYNSAGTKVAGIVFPGTTRTFPTSGGFYIPGSNLNLEVQELYNAIQATL